MKKLLLAVAFAGLVLGTSSCHKDHCPAYQVKANVSQPTILA